MRKKWAIAAVCAVMAVASLGGATALSMYSVSAEETESTASNVTQLLREPVISEQDASYRYVVTIPMGNQTIKSGDKLTLTYTVTTTDTKYVSLWVGDSEEIGSAFEFKNGAGTATYVFTDDYSGDIKLGAWSNSFTITAAELTTAPAVQENETEVQLLQEPVISEQDASYRYVVTIPMDNQTVKSGDKLTLTYTVTTTATKYVSLWVGDSEEIGNAFEFTNGAGTATYIFTDDYSGDIKLGAWSNSFTITAATLTIVPVAQSHNALIAGNITEQPTTPSLNNSTYTSSYKMGDVTGTIYLDVAPTFGQFTDNTYYITATDPTSVIRVDLASPINLKSAYLDEAVLKFSAKFDFASETARSAKVRIFYVAGEYGLRGYSETEIVGLESFRAGEWVEFSIPLSALEQYCEKDTWSQTLEKSFDWSKFSGFGLTIYSDKTADTHNVVSFGNVRIEGEIKDRALTGISVEGPTKTAYEAGDSFDAEGLKVFAVFDDNAKVQVFDYTIEAPAELATDSVVKVKWEDYEQTLQLTITSAYQSLEIATAPTKTAYKAGEVFETDGLVIKAVKADGTKDDVDLADVTYTYAGEMLQEGTEQITFTYLGMTVAQTITVADYENSVAILDISAMRKTNGDPADGWNFSSIGNSVISQDAYDAASDKSGKRAVTSGELEGGYFTAEASGWATSRVFEVGVADYNLIELYNDADNQAVLAITYRIPNAPDTAITIQVGLLNAYQNWNIGFHKADISSKVIADGEWHTVYVNISDLYGEIDGMGWTEASITGNVDFSKIAGFAIQTTAAIDISGAAVKWNGEADEVTRVDTYAPTTTYTGEMSLTFKEGDAAPEFTEATAFDNYDGTLDVQVAWQTGAVTDGKLNAGTYTVVLSATDAAGNVSNTYTVTVTVEAEGETVQPGGDEGDEPDPPQTGDDETDPPQSGNGDVSEPKDNNTGLIVGIVCAVVVVIAVVCGVIIHVKKKNKK